MTGGEGNPSWNACLFPPEVIDIDLGDHAACCQDGGAQLHVTALDATEVRICVAAPAPTATLPRWVVTFAPVTEAPVGQVVYFCPYGTTSDPDWTHAGPPEQPLHEVCSIFRTSELAQYNLSAIDPAGMLRVRFLAEIREVADDAACQAADELELPSAFSPVVCRSDITITIRPNATAVAAVDVSNPECALEAVDVTLPGCDLIDGDDDPRDIVIIVRSTICVDGPTPPAAPGIFYGAAPEEVRMLPEGMGEISPVLVPVGTPGYLVDWPGCHFPAAIGDGCHVHGDENPDPYPPYPHCHWHPGQPRCPRVYFRPHPWVPPAPAPANQTVACSVGADGRVCCTQWWRLVIPIPSSFVSPMAMSVLLDFGLAPVEGCGVSQVEAPPTCRRALYLHAGSNEAERIVVSTLERGVDLALFRDAAHQQPISPVVGETVVLEGQLIWYELVDHVTRNPVPWLTLKRLTFNCADPSGLPPHVLYDSDAPLATIAAYEHVLEVPPAGDGSVGGHMRVFRAPCAVDGTVDGTSRIEVDAVWVMSDLPPPARRLLGQFDRDSPIDTSQAHSSRHVFHIGCTGRCPSHGDDDAEMDDMVVAIIVATSVLACLLLVLLLYLVERDGGCGMSWCCYCLAPQKKELDCAEFTGCTTAGDVPAANAVTVPASVSRTTLQTPGVGTYGTGRITAPVGRGGSCSYGDPHYILPSPANDVYVPHMHEHGHRHGRAPHRGGGQLDLVAYLADGR